MRLLLSAASSDASSVPLSGQPFDELSDADLRALYAPPDGPWLRANMVSTVDGAATGPDGRSGSISNRPDKRLFGLLRAMADVVLVGAGTASAETYHPADRPLVVVSRRANVPPSLHAAAPGTVLLATCEAAEGLDSARQLLGGDNVIVRGADVLDLAAMRGELTNRGWTSVLCEGGPSLLGDLLADGLVDELCATVVPRLVGGVGPRIVGEHPLDAGLRLSSLVEDAGALFPRWLVDRR